MSGLMHQVHLWDTWSTLTGCVQAGTSVIDRPEQVNDRDEKWLLSFIDAMHYRARHNADDIIRKIPTRGVKNVLDIGGGSGVFSMAFVRKGKDINATVFDLPNVIPITKKYIRKEKLTGRIRTVSGDYNKDKLPKGFDLIFLSAIVHSNSYRENERLVKKCAASLNRGGHILIKDQVMDDARLNPARGALFALNMLVGTKGGDTYSEKEIKEWFDKAGIIFNRRINIPGGDSMMIGSK